MIPYQIIDCVLEFFKSFGIYSKGAQSHREQEIRFSFNNFDHTRIMVYFYDDRLTLHTTEIQEIPTSSWHISYDTRDGKFEPIRKYQYTIEYCDPKFFEKLELIIKA